MRLGSHLFFLERTTAKARMHVVAVGIEEFAVTRMGQPRVRRPEGESNRLYRLQQQCRECAPLFAPAREYQAVRQRVADLREAA